MIDFILSKMGILMFAVAFASTLLIFSASIKEVFLSDESIQISNLVAKQIKYMSESENLCSSKRVLLPKYIDIFGLSSGSNSIYYIMNISKLETDDGSNFVVFNMRDKRKNKMIALESFRTNANVWFYNNDAIIESDVNIDPTEYRAIYLLKYVASEDSILKDNLVFVPCKFEQGKPDGGYKDCYDKLAKIKTDPEYANKFYCVPTSASNDGDVDE